MGVWEYYGFFKSKLVMVKYATMQGNTFFEIGKLFKSECLMCGKERICYTTIAGHQIKFTKVCKNCFAEDGYSYKIIKARTKKKALEHFKLLQVAHNL